MGKVLAYLCGIAFLIMFLVGLWENTGWWMLLILASVVALPVAAAAVYPVAGQAMRQRQPRVQQPRVTRAQRRLAAVRRSIAELEAEAGLQVPTDGACPTCHAPLVTGARYCSQCRLDLRPAPVVCLCPTCHERQPEHARFCWACGEILPSSALERAP